MKSSMTRMFRVAAVALLAAGLAACGVQNQEAPSLIGPSGFAQSVNLTASPDRLPRDGSSQSMVTVTVRNESGQAVSGQRVIIGSTAGTLSAAEVVTGSDGRATFSVTAPPSGSVGNVIDVFATPVGGNFQSAVTRTLSIGMTGTSNATVPTPAFTFEPNPPEVRQEVTFDASSTTDEGAVCGSACTYAWSFGDGTTASGSVVPHTFATAGTFNVVLTVTDAAGSSATLRRLVTVSNVGAPVVTFTVSPNPPLAGQLATFSATATAATGHSIVRYDWDFGDGSSQTTTIPTVLKTYQSQGLYVVTLTVTDDVGQTSSASEDFTITNTAVNATISFSPTEPQVGQLVSFTAVNPSGANGATITSYEWNFGDPASGSNTATGQTALHQFTSANTFVVRLTITDSNGIVGVFTTNVTVD
jgi:PKD repeat protein